MVVDDDCSREVDKTLLVDVEMASSVDMDNDEVVVLEMISPDVVA